MSDFHQNIHKFPMVYTPGPYKRPSGKGNPSPPLTDHLLGFWPNSVTHDGNILPKFSAYAAPN